MVISRTTKKKSVLLRFYEELNDFLPAEKRKKSFSERIEGTKSVKQVIDAFGIPDSAVDLVLVNGHCVPFSHIIKDGDRISVYPKFESFDISTVTKLREKPLRRLDFVLDVHLGKLAKYLRLLGFNTLYHNSYSDHQIILLSEKTGRIILTRDKALLRSKQGSRGYLVKTTDPDKQIIEVIDRFDLLSSINPFSICLSCNSNVQKAEKQWVKDNISPDILSQYNEFTFCTGCGKVFWKGSHHQAMTRFIEKIKTQVQNPAGFQDPS